MNIAYRLKKVTINSFSVSNISFRLPETHKHTFDISFNEVINAEEKTLTVYLRINLYFEPEKETKLMSIQTETIFSITNFEDLVSLQEIPVPLSTQLLGVAVSTARGILLVKCADTAYADFILPVINPTRFYNAFENSIVRVIEKAKNTFAIGNTDGALKLYNQALCIDAMNLEALYNIAAIQNKKEEYEAALETISRFIQLNSTYYDAFYMRATIYYNLEKWQESLEDLNICLELHPNQLEALNDKANIYRLQKRFEEAISEAEKAIGLNPEFSFAYGTLAEIYGEQGREELFYEYLEKALEHDFPINYFMDDLAYEKYRYESRFKELLKKHNKL